MMNDEKIAVVTGGAGFIGSHMVDLLLSRGMAVRVVDDVLGGFVYSLVTIV
jgi:UDP-glucose 4-epimerase